MQSGEAEVDEMILKDAYFAGLIDGEGHVKLTQKRPNSLRPMVTVEMTCERTVMAIYQHFGVGTVRAIPRRKPHHKDQWQWRTVYNGALSVLRRTRPFLITKADDADRVLTYQPIGPGNWSRSK